MVTPMLLLALLLPSLVWAQCSAGSGPPCVQLSLGLVMGSEYTANSSTFRTFEFLGMRFAAPRPGRWAAPLEAQPWTGTYNATSFGPICPQLGSDGSTVLGSEDCLFVNVWTNNLPGASYSAPAPVFLWTYGGSFITGASSFPYYNGRNLVANNKHIVLVSFNYRLGPLGLLAHPALGTTMLFMEDQRLAYQWVRQHINAFGGDPNRVTLVGQSAGGDSTCLHSFSPPSQGLFHAMVIESGDCSQWNRPLSVALSIGQQFVTSLGCGASTNMSIVENCMLAQPLASIFAASTAMGGAQYISFSTPPVPPPWQPWIDGFNLLEPVLVSLNAGRWNPIPLIMGTNMQEFGFLLWTEPQLLTQYPTAASVVNGPLTLMVNSYMQQAQWNVASSGLSMAPTSAQQSAAAASLLRQYLSSPNNLQVFLEAGSAFLHLCGTRRMVQAFAAYSDSVFFYVFEHHPSIPGPPFLPVDLGAYHFAEVPFVFNNPSCFGISGCTPVFPPAESALSLRMGALWKTFVDSARSPNMGARPPALVWPPYRYPDYDQAYAFNLTDSLLSQPLAQICAPWDAIMLGISWPPGAQGSSSASASPGSCSCDDTALVGKAIGISFLISVIVAVLATIAHALYMRGRTPGATPDAAGYRLYAGDTN